MKLSVIILNYNVRYFLELCIYSVIEAVEEIDAEIIVIDNDSQDGSCAMVRECFPDITLIENRENVGFARANNQGVAIAKGEYICILNPDTVVGKNTFVKMLSKIVQLPHLGLVGPRLIDGTGNFLPESKRNIPSPLTSFRRLFGVKLGKVKNYYADHIQETGIGDADILVGAFMISKRAAYQSVGGFDEDYFMYGEDIDLSYKIKKTGLQNYYLGDVVVIHYKGESTDRNATYIRRFYGAMRLFYKKHFRSNFILDFLVSVAIRVLSVIQSFRNYDKEKRTIDHYYLISRDDDLATKLSDKLGKHVEIIALQTLSNLGDQNIEVIFDNQYIAFQEIIEAILRFKNERVTFKIRPKSCNYIIGSNFNDGKGEIIVF